MAILGDSITEGLWYGPQNDLVSILAREVMLPNDLSPMNFSFRGRGPLIAAANFVEHQANHATKITHLLWFLNATDPIDDQFYLGVRKVPSDILSLTDRISRILTRLDQLTSQKTALIPWLEAYVRGAFMRGVLQFLSPRPNEACKHIKRFLGYQNNRGIRTGIVLLNTSRSNMTYYSYPLSINTLKDSLSCVDKSSLLWLDLTEMKFGKGDFGPDGMHFSPQAMGRIASELKNQIPKAWLRN